MRRAALWLFLAALPWPAACTAAESFVCTTDTQCMADGAAGRCEAEGVCSFPDDGCPSGHRYGKLAGELSGQCVGEGSSGEGSSAADTRASTSEDTLELDGDGTTTSSSSTTTSATSSTSTTDGMPTSDATATSETSMTGPSPTTGTEPDPYGPCIDGACAEPGSVCFSGPTNVSVCAPLCDDETECPPALANTANIVCTPIGMASTGCVIVCMIQEDCPPDMQCELLEVGIGYCGWR